MPQQLAPRRLLLPLLGCLVLATTLVAQNRRDDARDLIVLQGGDELRGRVVQRFEPDKLTFEQAGKRRELPWAKVARVRTVAEDIAEILVIDKDGISIDAQWTLAQFAASRGLTPLAQLLALAVLLRDPDHQDAHALLGHKGEPGKWRWLIDGELIPAAQVTKRTLGKKFTLASEHFVLRSQSGLRAAVTTLLDLERTYAAFWRELGSELRPLSLFEPIEVMLYPSAQDLPKLSTLVLEPYCDPSRAGGGVIHTFLEPTAQRPAHLAGLAVEMLLYRTLLAPRAGLPATQRERTAPWIEVGLGRWFDARGTGKPGHLEFGAAQLDRLLADRVLRYRPYSLANFIHVDFLAFHDDGSASPFHVAHAAMLVAYFMDEQTSAGSPPTALRPRFLAYVRECFHDARGNASSGLDESLGAIGKLESLEKPWISWLSEKTGMVALRTPHEVRPRWSLRSRLVPPVIR